MLCLRLNLTLTLVISATSSKLVLLLQCGNLVRVHTAKEGYYLVVLNVHSCELGAVVVG
jgi:hypothetical protein